jgi:hypothetical protein
MVETTSKENSGVYFDHDNNSFAEQSGWVGKDDGLLVFDKNNNGKIDDGSELFGNNTILSNGNKAANGFEALKPSPSRSRVSGERISEAAWSSVLSESIRALNACGSSVCSFK